MSSLSQLSQQYSPIALKLAKSPKVQALAATVGAFVAAFVALRRLNRYLSFRGANNGIMEKTWDGPREIVVVTGGSSGIGANIVELLEQKNIKVIILDIAAPSRKLGRRTSFYEVDLSDADAIAAVADRIRSEQGHPTVLVNNAGFANSATILSVTRKQLQRLFSVNLAAPFLLIQEFLPEMVAKNRGHIVNVGSMASFSSQANNVDYGATKSGVLALHEGLLQELKHVYKAPAVRATIVHPTWVMTPMAKDIILTGKLGPYVTGHDVASAVVNQLTSGYGGQLVVPSTLGWVSSLRGLPTWFQEQFRDSVTLGLIQAIEETSGK